LVFWSPEVKINEPAAFQLTLAAPSNASVSSLPFQSLQIQFSEGNEPIIVQHAGNGEDISKDLVRRIDLGAISTEGEEHKPIEANLRWAQGSSLLFTGTLSSSTPRAVTVSVFFRSRWLF